ncbi:helicase domain protein [Nitzschia inconspicua]|uniref:Helicase domain protein n=1 Tax=Nitzschia inconspicua TaxID=303405 RepID=A0A9K3LS64_9STRA|nr:helicase domain protein [Nitzschia inconspicua]
MNVPYSNTLAFPNGYCSSVVMSQTFSEGDDREIFGDISKILHHFNKEDFNEDSSHLISNDISLSSLIFEIGDASLEPTPLRPDGIVSACPQNGPGTFAPMSLPPPFPLSIKRDFSSAIPGSRVVLGPNSRSVSSIDAHDACYVRPSKMPRLVSSSSIGRPARACYSRSGVEPELNVASSPVGSMAASNHASMSKCPGFSVDERTTQARRRSSEGSSASPTNQNSALMNHLDCFDDKSEDEAGRFRVYQSDQWMERFAELQEFKKQFGHCVVPHNYLHHGSPALAQWVKRQRFQWKQRKHNKRSTITEERMKLLSSLGFVFDSHLQSWEIKLASLAAFRKEHGHAGVPSKWHDKELAIWVKCQRRNYKLYCQGQKSAMTTERIALLESLDFNWNPRNL